MYDGRILRLRLIPLVSGITRTPCGAILDLLSERQVDTQALDEHGNEDGVPYAIDAKTVVRSYDLIRILRQDDIKRQISERSKNALGLL